MTQITQRQANSPAGPWQLATLPFLDTDQWQDPHCEDRNLPREDEVERLGICLSEHWMIGCKSCVRVQE
jgi:hypothetical protein